MTAAEDHPVWLAETGTHTLCLAARGLQEIGSKPPGVLVAAFPNVAHILIDTLGRQHVIVRCDAAHMHLVISGSAVVIGPVILGADVDRRDAIGTSHLVEPLRGVPGVVSEELCERIEGPVLQGDKGERPFRARQVDR